MNPETEDNIKKLSTFLLSSNQTIAVAESVTSGAIQTLISSADQASLFYQGGVTAYNLNQKAKLLKIDPMQGITNNCVSETISQQMASGVCRLFNSDWGLSITGYATVMPQQGINTLFAFYSLANKGQVISTNIVICPSNFDSLEAQKYYAEHVLAGFVRLIQSVAFHTTQRGESIMEYNTYHLISQ